MEENIVIVESPSKAHTIESYLGDNYKVVASVGHIRDLSNRGKGGLGIDIDNNFKPDYKIIEGKEKLVKDLKKLIKGKKVYLATDPDREGEAISFHLKDVLGLKDSEYSRVEFHEITKSSVLKAFDNLRDIDMNLVSSQETRRIIDRIIGFKVSTLLRSKIKSQSAGRVQSVALKLIVDLEKEINAFVSEAYYELEAHKDELVLKFVSYKGNKDTIKDKAKADEIINSLSDIFKVDSNVVKEVKRISKPAYTTSTMQQDASNKLNFTATKTMSLAQGLYEGKNLGTYTTGLITYMRTDSTRLADEFVKSAKSYIVSTYGKEYLGQMHTKEQKLAQDAHEAIRVTDITRTPQSIKKYLTSDEYKLYELIYTRTICSLMSSAIDTQMTVTFKNNDTLWRVTYTKNKFKGYLEADVYSKKEELDKLPTFNQGDEIRGFDVICKELFTKPKSRYTEATLIKDMEDLGIGRPSTYAQTLSTLKLRRYVTVKEKKLIPTEQGMLTTEALDQNLSSIFNVEYTANMETHLDMIAMGEQSELDELNVFYRDFMNAYQYALEHMEKVGPKMVDEYCPNCGSQLCERTNKRGQKFIACSAYPTCKYIKQEEKKEVIDTHVLCPNCKTGTFVERLASRGKNKGNKFYACSNYPKCKTIYSDKPTCEYCPNCGAIMLIDSNGVKYCSNKCEEVVEDLELINNLKEYRTNTYKKQHIRPYLVFTNAELDSIVSSKPKTIDELKSVLEKNPEDKIEKYGNDIITIVNNYLSNNAK